VRAIVEAHGGTITAASMLGKGTTITLSVPEQQPGPDTQPMVRAIKPTLG